MTEAHIVAEPPTDEAFYRAMSHVLNRLSTWLCDEREKLEPTTARWRALADVTAAIHDFTEMELHPPAGAVDPVDGVVTKGSRA